MLFRKSHSGRTSVLRQRSRDEVDRRGFLTRSGVAVGALAALILLGLVALRKRRTERLNDFGVALVDKAIIATITDLWDLGCERDVAAVMTVWRRTWGCE